MEEYCNGTKAPGEKLNSSNNERIKHENKQNDSSKEYQRKQSLLRTEKIMQQYYMLMEQLEYRMERHEQLTKLAQKSIKFTVIDRENRKVSLKK